MKHFLVYVILGICCQSPVAQESPSLMLPGDADTESGQLFKKYLSDTENAESKIRELLGQAGHDLAHQRYIVAISKLHIALVLGDYAPPNTSTILELNKQMGFAVYELHERQALRFLKKAIEISYLLNESGDSSRLQLIGQVAGLHIKLNEPDSALYWYRKSLAETKGWLRVGYASALNNVGVFYKEQSRYDSAMFYYQKAMAVLEDMKYNPVLFCSIQDNIAQEHERQGDYDFALKIYRFNDDVYFREKRFNRWVINRIRWMKAKKKAGYSVGNQELDFLYQYVEKNRKNIHTTEVLNFYQFAEDYFLDCQQPEKVRQYSRRYKALKHTVDQRNQDKMNRMADAFLSIQATRFSREMDLYRTRAEAASQSLRYNRRVAIILTTGGALVFLLMVLYLRKSRQELETTRRLSVAELRAKEMEALTIQQELELKKKDLTNVVLQNTQLFDHDQKIIERLSEIARQKENMGKSIHSLISDINSRNQAGDRALVIQHNIEQINAAFYDKLKTQFPALTKSETEICSYLRINLSNKDIALLKNVEYTSIKVAKTRLRKKLGISMEEDLYRFIQSI